MTMKNFFVVLVLSMGFVISVSCTKKQDVGAPKDALTTAEENLKKTPSFESHIALGLEYASRGMREQALGMYMKAKEMNANSPLAWNNICAELNAQGRHGEALPHCEKAVELDGKFTLARNNLLWTQNKLKESKVGILDRKSEILARKDASGSELLALGFEFYNLKDYTNAVEVWTAIKSSAAEYSKAQNNIATSYILTEQYDKAEQHLALALTLEPTNQLFINNRVWLTQKKNQQK